MKKIYFNICTIFALTLSCHVTHSMDIINNEPTILAIPGLNGGGSHPRYIKKCLNLKKNVTIKQVSIPSTWTTIDLGQKQCMSLLKDSIEKEDSNNIIIHATSQGTATALNYLSTQDKGRKIKALILEASLISGNNAIEHTVTGELMGCSFIKKIPLYYYWLPYLAKASFPFYSPAGYQVIKSISNIPKDIPIIIIHSKDDQQLSYKGSCALYHGLRANGNNNVYLISTKGTKHIRIIANKPKLQESIQAILKKHNIIKNENINKINTNKVDLKPYQPNPKNFKDDYNNILSKERWHSRIYYAGFAAAISTIAIISYFAGKRLGLL